MIPLLLAIFLLLTRPMPAIDGKATYMHAGRMEGAVAYHRLELDGAALFVALNDCRHIGRLVWLERGREILPARVADCAQARHVAERERLDYIAEVSYATALDWGIAGIGPAKVRIHFSDPRGIECESELSAFRCC